MNLVEGLAEYSTTINQYQIAFLCKYIRSSREVVLFIHGLACSANSFRNVYDRDYFSDKSLLIPDLIGFGKSSKPENYSYSMDDQAKTIEELLSILPQWDIHIVAHSMGGAIALLLNSNILTRVKSFANIEGNLIREDCGVLSRGIASLSYEEYKNDLYEKQLIEYRDHQQLRFEDTMPYATYKSAKSLVEWSDSGELLNRFKNLSCRKSYFYGEENKYMPVLKKIDYVSKYMIHECGHGMMTENPDEFYCKLSDFINSQD